MAFRAWNLKDEKWEVGPAGIDPKPMTEGRRKTLEMVTDAIIRKAMEEIVRGGVWECTVEVKAAEEAIAKVYLKVLDGSGRLSAFQEACDRWKETGTKRKGALNREPSRPAAD